LEKLITKAIFSEMEKSFRDFISPKPINLKIILEITFPSFKA